MKLSLWAKRILIFVGITFLITYIVEIGILRDMMGFKDCSKSPVYHIYGYADSCSVRGDYKDYNQRRLSKCVDCRQDEG